MRIDKRIKILNNAIIIIYILIFIMLVALANVDTIVKYIKL
jgi:hypothetical protein